MKLKKYLKSNRGMGAKLARNLSVTQQSLRYWSDDSVPAERVIPIYFATNKKVHPFEMRPDIYPPDLIKFKDDGQEGGNDV